MRPCFFAVHDARQAGVAVPVDVVARVGPVVAAEPGGVQERVDDGSIAAGPTDVRGRSIRSDGAAPPSTGRATSVGSGDGHLS